MKFELDETQIRVANEWIVEQKKKKKGFGTFGDRFEFRFLPTGLGIFSSVYDCLLKEEKSLDDHIQW